MKNQSNWVMVLAFGALNAGCAAEDANNASENDALPTAQSAVTANEKRIVPSAKLTRNDGHIIEFYDFGNGVMVGEEGLAGSSPVLPDSADTDLVELWNQLVTNGEPAPEAIFNLEAKRQQLLRRSGRTASKAITQREATSNEFGGTSLSSDATTSAARVLQGCNNGCCDYDWLSTKFLGCMGLGDLQWFLFNYGSTYANANDAAHFTGTVCAATGTSTWTFRMDEQFTRSIAEGHYYSYRYTTDAWFDNPDVRSSVNTAQNPHLHSYCGFVWFN